MRALRDIVGVLLGGGWVMGCDGGEVEVEVEVEVGEALRKLGLLQARIAVLESLALRFSWICDHQHRIAAGGPAQTKACSPALLF